MTAAPDRLDHEQLLEEFRVWSGGHDPDETDPDDREHFALGRSEEAVRLIFADQPETVLEGLVSALASSDEE